MTEQPGGDDRSGLATLLLCRWPGCVETLEWAGKGRPPSWCGKVVAGVRHTPVNAHRARLDAVPAAPTGQAGAEAGDRPVSRARGELARVADAVGAGLAQWRAETSAHELRMRALVDAAEAALGDLDGRALDTEIAAVRRTAAAAVDAAEQERDDAQRLRTAADWARDTAAEAADEAINDAAAAAEALSQAEVERDAAIAGAEEAHTLMAQAQGERDQERGRMEAVRADHRAELAAGRDEHARALQDLRQVLADARSAHSEQVVELRGRLEETAEARRVEEGDLRDRLREARAELAQVRAQAEAIRVQYVNELAAVRAGRDSAPQPSQPSQRRPSEQRPGARDEPPEQAD